MKNGGQQNYLDKTLERYKAVPLESEKISNTKFSIL